MAFLEKFTALLVRIENNQELQQFCQDNFGKTLKVMTVFKDRKEMALEDFPVALITRPYIRRESAGKIPYKEQNVSIYAGFRTEDSSKAAGLSIEFEELIEKAISVRTTHADDRAMAIMPADSATDEGKFHPIYFFGMDVLVKDR